MRINDRLISFSLNHPKQILVAVLTLTVLAGGLTFRLGVDNSPESLFSELGDTNPVYQQAMENSRLHNMVILGVINRSHEQGVFNPETFEKIIALSRVGATLAAEDLAGLRINAKDIIAPDRVESIQHAGLGQIQFRRLVQEAPGSTEEALRVKHLALANPLLKNTMVSENGQALALYFPVEGPNSGHLLRNKLNDTINSLGKGDDRFYITGLPVVTDTIDKAMTRQVLIGVLLSSLVLFGLLLLYFRKIQLSIPPLTVAFTTVIAIMALLTATGCSLHIITLSVFIFLVPVSIAGSILLVMEFIDRYREKGNRRQAIEMTMAGLFVPLSQTTITLVAAFAPLILFPVSAIRIFGGLTAIGLAIVWLLSITLVPSMLMLTKEEDLSELNTSTFNNWYYTLTTRFLDLTRSLITTNHWYCIGISTTVLILGVTALILSETNSNQLQLLKKNNKVTIADKVLNTKMGGTHEVLLVLSGPESDLGVDEAADWLIEQLSSKLRKSPLILESIVAEIRQTQQATDTASELAETLTSNWAVKLKDLPIEESLAHDTWSQAVDTLVQLRHQQQLFNRPDILGYIDTLQSYLISQTGVGTVHSVVDLVKTIHQAFFEGDPSRYTIPDTANAVTQALEAYNKSQKPEELFRFITPDYRQTTMRIRLNNADSKQLERLSGLVDTFLRANKPPLELDYRLAGSSYFNLILQEKVLDNLFKSFGLSLTMAFLVMSLFIGPVWGLMAMLPLTGTTGIIMLVNWATGWNYNLVTTPFLFFTLGLAVVYAIHFLHRSKELMVNYGTWSEVVKELLGEPARAIFICTVCIAVGSVSLLLVPPPYMQIAGVFLLFITLSAGGTTLLTLPAALELLQPGIYKREIKMFEEKANQDNQEAAETEAPLSDIFTAEKLGKKTQVSNDSK